MKSPPRMPTMYIYIYRVKFRLVSLYEIYSSQCFDHAMKRWAKSLGVEICESIGANHLLLSAGLIYLSVTGSKDDDMQHIWWTCICNSSVRNRHQMHEFSLRRRWSYASSMSTARLCSFEAAAFIDGLMAVVRLLSDWISFWNILEVCQIFVSSDQNTWSTCWC